MTKPDLLNKKKFKFLNIFFDNVDRKDRYICLIIFNRCR